MRISFKIVLGLLLFNAVFALYNPLFNTGYGDDAVGIDDETVNQYNLADMNMYTFLELIFTNANALMTAGIVSGIALTAALITKNYVYIGVGIFVGIVSGMYVSFSGIISQLGSSVSGSNVYVTGIITIIGIAIGAMVMFNVVDMFAPHPT